MYMKVAIENNNDELGNNNTETTGLVLLNTRAIGGYKSVSEMLKKLLRCLGITVLHSYMSRCHN